MSLEAALDATRKLKEALAGEIERARSERQLLRSLDADALFERARLRETFNSQTQLLIKQLGLALARAGAELDLSPVTTEGLLGAAPAAAVPLVDAIGEVRALSGALAELDALNRSLAARSLACVRAYHARVNPRAAAYDRRGARPAADTASCSRRA